MRITNNPYLVGFLILVSELTINITVSKLFGFELGKHNISAVILFMGVGFIIAQQTRQKAIRIYIVKVVATYFAFISLITLLMFLGDGVFTTLGLLLVLGMYLFFSLLSYAAFSWGQKIAIDAINKQEGVKQAGVTEVIGIENEK